MFIKWSNEWMTFLKSLKFPRELTDNASYLYFSTALKKHKQTSLYLKCKEICE